MIGLERIRARLLDLTNRNKLLNFRHTLRSSLSIVGVPPDALFDALLDGTPISFKSVPEPKGAPPKPKVVDHAKQLGLPVSVDLPERSMLPVVPGQRVRRVQTLHYPEELEAILRRISFAARTAIEESGTKLLHLIFGFLEWYESDNSNQSRLAPLLLVPVTIERAKAAQASASFAFEITYSFSDQIEENLSLREKLKREFGFDMPTLLDGDSPESYFRKFQGILAAKPQWRLRRRVTLGLVSFAKLLMFRDLDPKTWPKETDLLEHPRIRDFFEGTKGSDASFAEEYDIDALEDQGKAPALIHDADSSQHSALVDAIDGKNLVIEGPPGTGKSQTITNLIASTLAQGKTVLFVSEKLAALEVVRRRLDQAGLGIFCLELHSHKTDKRKLLDELEERLAAKKCFAEPKNLSEKRKLLLDAKRQLLTYARLINAPFSALGCTGFDVIWRRESCRQALRFDPTLVESIKLERDSSTRLSKFDSDRALLEVYGRQLRELNRRFPDLQKHPWRHIANADLSYSGEQQLCARLAEIHSRSKFLIEATGRLTRTTGISLNGSLEAITRLVEKCERLPDVQAGPTRAILSVIRSAKDEAQVRSFVDDVIEWRKRYAALRERLPAIQEQRDPKVFEPLRLACSQAIQFRLGHLDGLALATLADAAEAVHRAMRSTGVLHRELLARWLLVCERSGALSRLVGFSYRKAKRAFRRHFILPPRASGKVITDTCRKALDVLNAVSEERKLPYQGPLSYDEVGTLMETVHNITAAFNRFNVSSGRNSVDVLAAIDAFSLHCQTAAALAEHPARRLIGKQFQGPDTDLAIVSGALNAIEAIKRQEIPEALRSWLLASDTDTRLLSLGEELATLRGQVRALDDALTAFAKLGQLNPRAWWGPEPLTLAGLERTAEAALRNTDSLSEWIQCQRSRKELQAAGLSAISDLAESKVIGIEDMIPAYEYIFYNTLARQLTRGYPELLQFSGLRQNAVRERFVQLDKELIELNRQAVALLASRRLVPPGIQSGPVGQRTELSLIKQEIGKTRRHIPIRQLVQRAGRALQALKPCFMMGPLSVAQYITPGHLKFDLVVMDEASQLKPEDAMGAIARGSQLIVVGDPKQLPPSTFFERQFDPDPDEEPSAEKSVVEEHESVLDVAATLYQPMRQLRWHYRSRHDSLIAFSNAEFYRNRLLVFPSPMSKTAHTGIQFRYIADGVYEAGQAKFNRQEAERVVNAVLNHLRSCPELSLGVVALNHQQRELIDDLLTERTRHDEMARLFFERQKETAEPFFVKNLENVQGDERDVIFISVTYGRDKHGNLFQRFGPINLAQGPRRLNVLFTRAKHRVVVFSSIDPDELRTDSSSPPGVAILKAYLRYAKTGQLEAEKLSEVRQPQSDFEIAVANALKRQGFECESQVGVAGFFIDIAVRHPQQPGSFILGIECDGASYHSAKSTRDRDRLRQMILENLGWAIHRIWSTDWFTNSRREIEKVTDLIRQLSMRPRFANASTALPARAEDDRGQVR